jgi:Hemerythrin HHE cation binding domain
VSQETKHAAHDVSSIAAEHERLRHTLEHIESVTQLADLILVLQELRAELSQHFDEEEGDDGLARIVGTSNPAQLTMLGRLFQQHETFLRTADDLTDRSRDLLEGPKKAILREARRLVEDLRSHEAAETALLMDAVNTDIGAGD